MAEFNRLAPLKLHAQFASVATNASAINPVGNIPFRAQVLAARVINSAVAAVTSGTTAGSAVTVTLYKNASAAGSIIAQFNGSGTTIATQATQAMPFSGTVNKYLAAGDTLLAEYTGGAANNASNAGLIVDVDLVYGFEDGNTPAAATGPA